MKTVSLGLLVLVASLGACATEVPESSAPNEGAAGGPSHFINGTGSIVGSTAAALSGCHIVNQTDLPLGANLAPEYQALVGWLSQFAGPYSCRALAPTSMRCVRNNLSASYTATRQAPNTAPVAIKMTCAGNCSGTWYANWNGVLDPSKTSEIDYSSTPNSTDKTFGLAKFSGNKNDGSGGFYYCRQP